MVDPNSLALLSLRGLAVECISMFSHRPAMYTQGHDNMSSTQDSCKPILHITICELVESEIGTTPSKLSNRPSKITAGSECGQSSGSI